MQHDVIADSSGAAVEPCKNHTQKQRIKKLIKISVKQCKKQTGKDYGSLLSVWYETVDQIFSKHKLFHHGRNQHRCQKDHTHIHLLNRFCYRISIRCSSEDSHCLHKKAADHISKIGKTIAKNQHAQKLT